MALVDIMLLEGVDEFQNFIITKDACIILPRKRKKIIHPLNLESCIDLEECTETI